MSDGYTNIGDQLIGWSERNLYLYWDITSDEITERYAKTLDPFYRYFTSRYGIYNHILYSYTTRYLGMDYNPIPITERNIYGYYCLFKYSERSVYYYLDTSWRYCYTEGLLTQTPLLLKYPKYYSWDYVPRKIEPEFTVWSFYKLSENDITVYIESSLGKNIILNSGKNKENFTIDKIREKYYKITVHVDDLFDNNEEIDIKISMYDVKGNYLKPGLW